MADDSGSSPYPHPERLNALLAEIAHTGELVTEDVSVPGVDLPVRVTHPTNTNLLLDQIAADPEQNLPYWAELWPSGIALAAAIAAQPQLVAGLRCLELGCGAGITAALAIANDAHVLATDYARESLTLTRITSLRHTGMEPATLQMNWRDIADQDRLLTDGPFPIVLAADVLYERRDIDPLLDLIERIVAPGGLFWLAHPGRPPARVFLERVRERGWAGAATEYAGPWPDPNDALVVTYVHALRREKGSKS